MSNTIRAALERLLNAVDVYDAIGMDVMERLLNAVDVYDAIGMDVMDDAIAAARTTLAAEPVGEGPTDQELDDFVARVWPHSPGEIPDDEWRHDMAETIRAAIDEIGLARWGRPATPQAPEAGSAAALATWLRNHSGQCVELGRPDWAHMADRAADTLEAFSLGGWIVPTVEEAPPAPEPGEVAELVAVLQVEARSEDICGNTTVITAAELRRAATLLQQQQHMLGLACQELDDRLARWGRPATPAAPEAGEVGELAAELNRIAEDAREAGQVTDAQSLTRAATLLQQQAAPAPAVVPVAVTERPWEREEWCDRLGRCWMGDPGGQGFIASWRLCRPEDAPSMTVSLPHHAIPLPQGGEGEG